MINIDIAQKTLQIEAESIQKIIKKINNKFYLFIKELYKTKGRVIVIGMGKSGYMAMKIAATLSSTGTPSFFMHPSEAIHGDLGMVNNDDVILMLSYSGETNELLKLIPFLKENKNTILSITNKSTSTLAKHSKHNISMNINKEACSFNLTPTVSSTTMLAIGDAIAMVLMNAKGFTEKDFARFHPGGNLGRRLLTKISDEMITKDLPIINMNKKIIDAINIISWGRLGMCAIVNNKNELVGIITDGDIRRIFEKYDRDFVDLIIGSVMNIKPIAVNENILIVDAEKIMDDKKIHQLIVLNDKKNVVGILPYRK